MDEFGPGPRRGLPRRAPARTAPRRPRLRGRPGAAAACSHRRARREPRSSSFDRLAARARRSEIRGRQPADQRVEDGLILWQRDGALDAALRRAVPTWPQPDPQWIEDRFWVWIHYGAAKLGRGELFECLDVLAALRAMVFGPLIARDGGHRAAGVRRLEQMAPGLVPALEATVGDHTAPAVLPRCARRSPSTASCAATPPRWSGAPAPRPRASITSLRSRRLPVHSHGRGSGDIGCGQGRERADAGCEDQAAGDDEDQADRD